MSTADSLNQLKLEFLSNNQMSTRQLFCEMEKVILGTNGIETHLNSLLQEGTGDEILAEARKDYVRKLNELGRPPKITERYPSLEGKIEQVVTGSPLSFDIASESKQGGMGLYVFLDGSWVARCNSGDDLDVIDYNFQIVYRLVNV